MICISIIIFINEIREIKLEKEKDDLTANQVTHKTANISSKSSSDKFRMVSCFCFV